MILPKPKPAAVFDAVGLGYNSLDHLCVLSKYPEKGTKAGMQSYSVQGGGQAATACAALAILGFNVRYLGKFGAGISGRMAEESLTRLGIDTTNGWHTGDCPNQIAIVWIDGESGERTIVNKRGDSLKIAAEDLDREAICSGRILLLDAHDIPAMVQAATWAKEEGIPVLLDVEKEKPGIDKLLNVVDYIITNEDFPPAYTGIQDMKGALLELSGQGAFVASTLGERGSLALFRGEFIQTPAIDVQVVDSTGAGDVFHGAFAAGLLMDYDIERVLQFANAAAGLKCRKIGGRDGIPTLKEVLAVMD